MARFFYVYFLVSKADPSIHYTGVARKFIGALIRSQPRQLSAQRQVQALESRNGDRVHL